MTGIAVERGAECVATALRFSFALSRKPLFDAQQYVIFMGSNGLGPQPLQTVEPMENPLAIVTSNTPWRRKRTDTVTRPTLKEKTSVVKIHPVETAGRDGPRSQKQSEHVVSDRRRHLAIQIQM